LHPGIVEHRVQAAESGDGLLNHRGHFRVVGDIAPDGNGIVAGRGQLLGR